MLNRVLLGALARAVFLGVFTAALLASLHGQNQVHVPVSGIVSNLATGDLLPGAPVTVDGSTLTATSERGGGYSLMLPEGTHTLVVSFSAPDTVRLPVTVTPAQRVVRDLQMTSSDCPASPPRLSAAAKCAPCRCGEWGRASRP